VETAVSTQFRLQPCHRCRRETIQALRSDHRICSTCEPAVFERAAVEAGRNEFLR
jgi:hypothetical protein